MCSNWIESVRQTTDRLRVKIGEKAQQITKCKKKLSAKILQYGKIHGTKKKRLIKTHQRFWVRLFKVQFVFFFALPLFVSFITWNLQIIVNMHFIWIMNCFFCVCVLLICVQSIFVSISPPVLRYISSVLRMAYLPAVERRKNKSHWALIAYNNWYSWLKLMWKKTTIRFIVR